MSSLRRAQIGDEHQDQSTRNNGTDKDRRRPPGRRQYRGIPFRTPASRPVSMSVACFAETRGNPQPGPFAKVGKWCERGNFNHPTISIIPPGTRPNCHISPGDGPRWHYVQE